MGRATLESIGRKSHYFFVNDQNVANPYQGYGHLKINPFIVYKNVPHSHFLEFRKIFITYHFYYLKCLGLCNQRKKC